MFIDPFGYTITEATPYDVIEKMTAGVSISSPFFRVKGGELMSFQKKNVQAEPQFPTYREVGSTTQPACVTMMLMTWLVELCGQNECDA